MVCFPLLRWEEWDWGFSVYSVPPTPPPWGGGESIRYPPNDPGENGPHSTEF